MELDGAAWGQPAIHRLGELCRCPDENIGVPNRRQPEFRVAADFNPGVADMVLDGRKTGLLGQAEERPFHRIPLVANGDVGEVGRE